MWKTIPSTSSPKKDRVIKLTLAYRKNLPSYIFNICKVIEIGIPFNSFQTDIDRYWIFMDIDFSTMIYPNLHFKQPIPENYISLKNF
jgi:hypothetical protein